MEPINNYQPIINEALLALEKENGRRVLLLGEDLVMLSSVRNSAIDISKLGDGTLILSAFQLGKTTAENNQAHANLEKDIIAAGHFFIPVYALFKDQKTDAEYLMKAYILLNHQQSFGDLVNFGRDLCTQYEQPFCVFKKFPEQALNTIIYDDIRRPTEGEGGFDSIRWVHILQRYFQDWALAAAAEKKLDIPPIFSGAVLVKKPWAGMAAVYTMKKNHEKHIFRPDVFAYKNTSFIASLQASKMMIDFVEKVTGKHVVFGDFVKEENEMGAVIVDRNYILTDEMILWENVPLYRIRAIRNFGKVKAGDLGGFVESYEHLYENAWVSDDAKVYDDAQVYGNAQIKDKAAIYGSARIYDHAVVAGNAKIYDEAIIAKRANVHGAAQVSSNARIRGGADIFGDVEIDFNVNNGIIFS